MGVYFPVNFTISWAMMPPKKALIGEIELAENETAFLKTSSSSSHSKLNSLAYAAASSLQASTSAAVGYFLF